MRRCGGVGARTQNFNNIGNRTITKGGRVAEPLCTNRFGEIKCSDAKVVFSVYLCHLCALYIACKRS